MALAELRAERDALLARIAPLEAELRRLNAEIRQAERDEQPARPDLPGNVVMEAPAPLDLPEIPSTLDAAKTEAQGHRLPQEHVPPVVPTGPLVP